MNIQDLFHWHCAFTIMAPSSQDVIERVKQDPSAKPRWVTSMHSVTLVGKESDLVIEFADVVSAVYGFRLLEKLCGRRGEVIGEKGFFQPFPSERDELRADILGVVRNSYDDVEVVLPGEVPQCIPCIPSCVVVDQWADNVGQDQLHFYLVDWADPTRLKALREELQNVFRNYPEEELAPANKSGDSRLRMYKQFSSRLR